MSRLLVLLAVGVLAIVGLTSPASAAAPVTIAPVARTGGAVTFAGRVAHAPHHSRVTIQRRTGGRWRAVGSVRTGREGAYRLTLHLPTHGLVAVRASVKVAGRVRTSRTLTFALGVRPVPLPSATPVPTPTPTTPARIPPAGTLEELDDVACPTDQMCWAVGRSNAEMPAVAQLSGTNWTATALSMPAGEPTGELGVVACPTSDFCAAAGGTDDSTFSSRPMVATWANGSWATSVLPEPAGMDDTALYEIACSGAGSCVALGQDQGPTSTSPHTTVVATLAAGHWATAVLSVPPAPLACAPGGDCYITDGTAIWTLHDGAWSSQPTPSGAGWPRDPLVEAATCPTADTCWAVGSDGEQVGTAGLVLHLVGGAWTAGTIALPPTAPTGARGVFLDGISCASATSCAAVGSYSYPLQPGNLSTMWSGSPLLATLSGGSWTSASPAAPGANADSYGLVACPQDGTCTATGSEWTAGAAHFQVAELSDGVWTRHDVAVPDGGWDGASLACPTSTRCVAAGALVPAPDQYATVPIRPLVGVETDGVWSFRDPTGP